MCDVKIEDSVSTGLNSDEEEPAPEVQTQNLVSDEEDEEEQTATAPVPAPPVPRVEPLRVRAATVTRPIVLRISLPRKLGHPAIGTSASIAVVYLRSQSHSQFPAALTAVVSALSLGGRLKASHVARGEVAKFILDLPATHPTVAVDAQLMAQATTWAEDDAVIRALHRRDVAWTSVEQSMGSGWEGEYSRKFPGLAYGYNFMEVLAARLNEDAGNRKGWEGTLAKIGRVKNVGRQKSKKGSLAMLIRLRGCPDTAASAPPGPNRPLTASTSRLPSMTGKAMAFDTDSKNGDWVNGAPNMDGEESDDAMEEG